MKHIARFLPQIPESLSDMIGVVTISLGTIVMLWLPDLIGA